MLNGVKGYGYINSCGVQISGVYSILHFDNILILIFVIISIAFIMIKQFAFSVSCQGACFIKLKCNIYIPTVWLNFWLVSSLSKLLGLD